MKQCHHRWMIIALCAQAAAVAVAAEDTTYQSRKLNPSHKMQQTQDIYKSAAKVQASQDAETRGVQQQELCKKLLAAEKYDEALKVAHEIASTPGINPERRAAHHFLVADIYNRKMQASPSAELMQQNRQRAMQAAQEVVAQKYPAKWHTGEMAASLLKDLQDPKHMQQVADWVTKRQCNGCDTNKFYFAQRQLSYMESAGHKTASVGASGVAAVKRGGSSLLNVFGRKNREAEPAPQTSAAQLAAAKPTNAALSAPWGSGSKVENRAVSDGSVNIAGAGKVTFSRADSKTGSAFVTNQQLQQASSRSPQPSSLTQGTRAPIIIDGASIRRTTPIEAAVQQSPLAELAQNAQTAQLSSSRSGFESTPGVTLGGASTYATGQVPSRGAVKPTKASQ